MQVMAGHRPAGGDAVAVSGGLVATLAAVALATTLLPGLGARSLVDRAGATSLGAGQTPADVHVRDIAPPPKVARSNPRAVEAPVTASSPRPLAVPRVTPRTPPAVTPSDRRPAGGGSTSIPPLTPPAKGPVTIRIPDVPSIVDDIVAPEALPVAVVAPIADSVSSTPLSDRFTTERPTLADPVVDDNETGAPEDDVDKPDKDRPDKDRPDKDNDQGPQGPKAEGHPGPAKDRPDKDQ